MDRLDQKLLFELSYNSRQSLTDLARSLKTSKQVVQYRIKNLDIRPIPIIDPSALGFTNYLIFAQTNREVNISDRSITWAARTTGNFDIVLSIYAKTPRDFHTVYKKLSKDFSKHHFIISIEEHPMHLKYLGSMRRPIITIGNSPLIPLDDRSLKILKALGKDARTPIVTLANSLNLSIDVTKNRLKKLNKVIKGYTIDFNINRLNMHEYELLINAKDDPRFIAYLKDHPNITFIVKCIGKWDLLLKVEAENNSHFNDILKDIRKNFPETIHSYQTLIILENLKYSFLPY